MTGGRTRPALLADVFESFVGRFIWIRDWKRFAGFKRPCLSHGDRQRSSADERL